MTPLFRPNPNFDEEIKKDPDYAEFKRGVGEVVAAQVRAASPSATFSRTIEVDEEGSVITTSSFWHIFEYGSVNNPVYAPFRRGVVDAGLRMEDSPKT